VEFAYAECIEAVLLYAELKLQDRRVPGLAGVASCTPCISHYQAAGSLVLSPDHSRTRSTLLSLLLQSTTVTGHTHSPTIRGHASQEETSSIPSLVSYSQKQEASPLRRCCYCC
jgi:hypothetical protein